jgi:chromosome partitioning protein
MRTLAVINQKGGVGKTTTTLNLGAGLAREGKRVLLVDLDPQAHLTYSLGVPAFELERTIHDLLAERAGLRDVWMETGGMRLLPAALDLFRADVEFGSLPRAEFRLRQHLEHLRAGPDACDFVLLDCPPNLGFLTISALCAADELLIPLMAEFLAMQSLTRLLETVDTVTDQLNTGLEIAGIVLTRFSKRKRLHRESQLSIRDHLGDLLFETAVRENVALAESPSFGLDIFRYKPRSAGALDYRNLSLEVTRRGGNEQ